MSNVPPPVVTSPPQRNSDSVGNGDIRCYWVSNISFQTLLPQSSTLSAEGTVPLYKFLTVIIFVAFQLYWKAQIFWIMFFFRSAFSSFDHLSLSDTKSFNSSGAERTAPFCCVFFFMSKSTLVVHFDLFAHKHRRDDATVEFLSANHKRMVDFLLLEKKIACFPGKVALTQAEISCALIFCCVLQDVWLRAGQQLHKTQWQRRVWGGRWHQLHCLQGYSGENFKSLLRGDAHMCVVLPCFRRRCLYLFILRHFFLQFPPYFV